MTAAGMFCRELIGRSSELAFLLERIPASAGRTSAAVIVRGEAGIGKSRLIDEAVRAARDRGYRAARGSTREFANAPYSALVEALEPLEIDVVGRLGDGPGDAKMRRFSELADAIAANAERESPGLLIVIEDLHWADVGTLELLRFLATRLADRNVTVIVSYRPDELEADSARARSILALEREASDVVALDALPAKQIDRLLASVVRDGERTVSSDVLAQIRDLSDGRPLFAEELLRGVFERLDRNARAEPTVPTSIRVTVRERFGALSETDRTVLLHAALIGRRFSARFVASFSAQDLLVVYAALRRARDLQLIVEESGEDGDAFAFRHALTREAIYAELLRAETRLMHAKVANALAAEQEPDVAAIAEHLWFAGDHQAAAAWSERAGDDAYAVYAYADAARAYERAYRVAVDRARRANLAERTAEAWYALGDLEQSVEWFDRAADARQDNGELRSSGRLRLRKARALFESGRYQAGLLEADRIAMTADLEPALRIEAELMVAGLLTAHGRLTEALERLERAELLPFPPDPFLSARFSSTFAMALGLAGKAAEASARFAAATEGARMIDDNDLLLRTYNNWGNHEVGYGTLTRALELYDEAMNGATKTNNQRLAVWTGQNAALAALLSGDLGRARQLLGVGMRIEHGVSRVHRWTVALLLRLDVLQGLRVTEALTGAERTLDEAIDDFDLPSVSMLAASIVHALAAEGRVAEAGDVLARVVPVFDRVDVPYWLVDVASRYGDTPVRARARALIAETASQEGALAAQGYLALLDAREALRRRRRSEAATLAQRAVAAFRTAGWVLEEGYALELAGQVAQALALFGRIGAGAEVHRNTHDGVVTRRRGESTLTGREREIAGLVRAGHPTRAIAETLVISERTVETHIAAIYRKLGVPNRQALAKLLTDGPS